MTASRVRIRFKGLAGTGHDNQSALSRMTGYRLIKDGQDYVVYDDDPKLREPIPQFLQLSEKIDLRAQDGTARLIEEIGKAPIPPDISMPSEVGILGEMGFLSKLDAAVRPFFFAKQHQLEKVIPQYVLPLLTELSALTARVASVNITTFYSRVSTPKLSLLVSEFGAQEAESAIFEKRLLSGVLPAVFEPQELFNALITNPPYIVSLGMHRPNCMACFSSNHWLTFDHRLFQTIPNYLAPETNPLQARGRRATLVGNRFRGESDEFVQIAAEAANAFWNFFTAPLYWTDESGVVDILRQLKAMSLGRLLVSDVLAIQRTSSSFGRERIMFEFFDKLAGLCVERSDLPKKDRRSAEAKWASHMMQDEMLELVCRILRYHGKTRRKRIFSLLSNFAKEIRTSVVRDISEMHKASGVTHTPELAAEYVRLVRNFAHGTFLSGNRFEKSLLRMSPVVPIDAPRIPWLYLMALALEPDYFVRQAIAILPAP